MSVALANNLLILDYIQDGLTLEIISEGDNAIYLIDENNGSENGEAPVQILEGRSYDYEFSDSKYRLKTRNIEEELHLIFMWELCNCKFMIPQTRMYVIN